MLQLLITEIFKTGQLKVQEHRWSFYPPHRHASTTNRTAVPLDEHEDSFKIKTITIGVCCRVESEKMSSIKRLSYKGKTDARDLLVHTGASIPLKAFEEIEVITKERQLKLAYVARKLILRGLAAYHRDGLLAEPADIPRDLTKD
jgi:hypothetical protein